MEQKDRGAERKAGGYSVGGSKGKALGIANGLRRA